MTYGTVHGLTPNRPGDKPFVERFLATSFTIPVSVTGGTATNLIAINLAALTDPSYRNIQVQIFGLKTATTFSPGVGTGALILSLSTDSGVTAYSNDYFEQLNTLVPSATIPKLFNVNSKQNALFMDNLATYNYLSATQTLLAPGARLDLTIKSMATDPRMDWTFSWMSSASFLVAETGIGQCTATQTFNGLKFAGNGINPSWTTGNVEVWVERINYNGVRP